MTDSKLNEEINTLADRANDLNNNIITSEEYHEYKDRNRLVNSVDRDKLAVR